MQKSDPTKWLAIGISVVSLAGSMLVIYFQFFWQHDDFKAQVLNVGAKSSAVFADILVWNSGNHVELLGSITMTSKMEAYLFQNPPILLKPGEAEIVHIAYKVPPTGIPLGLLTTANAFEKEALSVAAGSKSSKIDASTTELPFELMFTIVNFRSSGAPSGPSPLRYHILVDSSRKPLVVSGLDPDGYSSPPVIDLYRSGPRGSF